MAEPELINTGTSGELGMSSMSLMLCPRRWARRYRLRLQDEAALPLLRGTLLHVGAAHYYRRRQALEQREDPERWYEPETAMELVRDLDADYRGEPFDAAITAFRGFITSKFARFAGRVLGVEIPVDFTYYPPPDMVEPLRLRPELVKARVDLLISLSDSRTVHTPDHKCVNQANSGKAYEYATTLQFLHMEVLGQASAEQWRADGLRWGGAILNLIQADGHKQLQPPLPDRSEMIRRMPLTVCYARAKIRELDESGLDPKEWPMTIGQQTCKDRYSPCSHLSFCQRQSRRG